MSGAGSRIQEIYPAVGGTGPRLSTGESVSEFFPSCQIICTTLEEIDYENVIVPRLQSPLLCPPI